MSPRRSSPLPRVRHALLCLLCGAGGWAGADTIILHTGRKIEGEILRQDRRAVTVQVDEKLRLTLYRESIREIRTNAVTKFGADPNKVGFEHRPGRGMSEDGLPLPEIINPVSFKVPAPLLVTHPDFKPKGTFGGLSDGKTLGVDGEPLSDHRLYANDTFYFIKRVRDGLDRSTVAEEQERVAALRQMATQAAIVNHLNEDLKTGIMLESPVRTRDMLLETQGRLQENANAYAAKFKEDPFQAAEYPLADTLSKLDSALRTYDLAAAKVQLEERMSVRDRIDLEAARTDRGRALRERMKSALVEMSLRRADLLTRYGFFYKVGMLEELHETPPVVERWTVAREQALLFPYQRVEGTAAFDGLWEDSEGKAISAAKPVVLPQGVAVEFLQRKIIPYPKTESRPEGALEVVQLSVASADLTDYRTERKIPFIKLRGWMLADRLELVKQ